MSVQGTSSLGCSGLAGGLPAKRAPRFLCPFTLILPRQLFQFLPNLRLNPFPNCVNCIRTVMFRQIHHGRIANVIANVTPCHASCPFNPIHFGLRNPNAYDDFPCHARIIPRSFFGVKRFFCPVQIGPGQFDKLPRPGLVFKRSKGRAPPSLRDAGVLSLTARVHAIDREKCPAGTDVHRLTV